MQALMEKEDTLTAEAHAASLDAYIETGTRRAEELGNRGVVRYGLDGRLHPDILEAYWEHGFYVFEGVVNISEIEELRANMDFLLERAPTGRESKVDAKGRPAFGLDFAKPIYNFIKPLSDPWGGTDVLNGRHPTKMSEPEPKEDAPKEVVHIMGGMCQSMPAGLRLYGHPDLLAIAAAINGDDFVPYNDATFVKQPGLGGSVSWHQDGVTHWNSPDWDMGIHGFNFQVQLYECTPRNGLWVMPGTHKAGRINIKQRVAENNGSDQLPGAVPLICQPGDATVVNRQMLHCSFANTSEDLRISLTFGFHRRKSVLGARGALSQGAEEFYDETRIFDRSSVVAVAIDARAQYYPGERSYEYQPFVGLEEQFRFNEENAENIIRDYFLKDLSI